MMNIYEQVSSNKRRSTLIVFLFIVFISFAGYAISYAFNDQSLLPIAIIYSFVTTGISYFAGPSIVLSLNRARPATREEFFDFYTVTENLSIANQTPVPKIYVVETDAMNAFATGRDPQHAVVCATTGLLQKLDRTELEGVIAHELSHVKNYDTLLMTLVSMLVGTLSILINITSRSNFFRRNRNDEGPGGIFAVIGIILIIFAPLIAQLIQLAISRRREFLADSSAAMLTRQPSGLISALQKISADPNIMTTASTATSSLYICNPFKGNKLASLFSTHPQVEDRIKALQGMEI
jgi:heat shock protein HtpX